MACAGRGHDGGSVVTKVPLSVESAAVAERDALASVSNDMLMMRRLPSHEQCSTILKLLNTLTDTKWFARCLYI